MLRDPSPSQCELEMATLEELVPLDHLLRLIDRYIRFDFIREKTAHLYCADNGRLALDPVRLFKMLFIGYLFGIRSDRQLMREIQVNVAYRWFLGLRLTDKVPDASTLSQNRRRRFAGTPIEQEIFDAIVERVIEHRLIGGRVFACLLQRQYAPESECQQKPQRPAPGGANPGGLSGRVECSR